MAFIGRLLQRGALFCSGLMLVPEGVAMGQQFATQPAPQVITNPYCAGGEATFDSNGAMTPAPYVVTPSKYAVPPAEFALRAASASTPSAANSAATLNRGHVVYPAATNAPASCNELRIGESQRSDVRYAATPRIKADQPELARVEPMRDEPLREAPAAALAVGLPRDRVAALGAALQVPTLRAAYRANVAAVDGPRAAAPRAEPQQAVAATEPRSIFAGLGRSIEPPRFAPASDAAPMLQQAMSPSTPRDIAITGEAIKRDAAVQPVVWLNDLATTKIPTNAARPQDAPTAGNPLRREVAEDARSYGGSTAETSSTNPLR